MKTFVLQDMKNNNCLLEQRQHFVWKAIKMCATVVLTLCNICIIPLQHMS